MSFQLYNSSVETWQAVYEDMSAAKESILIELYIFLDDTTQYDFVSLLCQKAMSGVTVILILDAFGSSALPKTTITKLTDAGVDLVFFRHWLHRTHRKLFLIDQKIAFLGGVNIFRESQTWDDLHVRITGTLTRRLLQTFARSYRLAGGRNNLPFPIKNPKLPEQLRVWVIEHTPAGGRRKLKRYYLDKIKQAESSITLVTPYFMPRKWLLQALAAAQSRGVKVTILLPEQTNSTFTTHINQHYGQIALKLGFDIFIQPRMNHAKAMLIDNREGMVGSGNLDSLSFERNSELGIFFTNRKLVNDLDRIFQTWLKSSKALSPRPIRINIVEWILVWGYRLAEPFI